MYNLKLKMKTVGQLLKEAREAELYTLEDVEKALKIRKEMLVALEADDYKKLPPPTFIKGFIKNYAKFLNLDGKQLLAMFRRQFSEREHKPYVMDAFVHPVKEPRFKLTPGKTFGGVIALVILTFFAYLWMQYRQLSGGPALQIINPPDQMTTENAEVVVEGKTDAENKVLINNQEVKVGVEGDFKQSIILSSPVNKLSIMAISRFGQKNQIERVVYLKQ